MTEVEQAARAERAAVLATVARDVRDLALAEDAVQEALLAALRTWPATGVPVRPGAWLTVVARRHALRVRRRDARTTLGGAALDRLAEAAAVAPDDAPALPDAQLELLFACCHPALAVDAQVALTLRAVAGLTTAEIARAFLVSEATLAQRLVRAQRKIRDSGIPFAVPDAAQLPARLAGVLGVVYLVFTEGHASAGRDGALRTDLCDEAVRLARLVATLLPDEPEALGLAALVLAHDARRAARIAADGARVPLAAQDRSRYDAARLAEAQGLLDRAMGHRASGPYQLQAAIALLHGSAAPAAGPDWPQIAALYDALLRVAPSPSAALGRATAHGHAFGPAAGLAVLAGVEGLDDRVELHVTRASLLEGSGNTAAARASLRRALALTDPAGEAAVDLRRRLAALSGH